MFALLALSAPCRGAAIVINEYGSSVDSVDPLTGMTSTEYIEFVITENISAASLANYRFGDSNSATSQMNSIFQFNAATLSAILSSAGITEFLAGTILTVKGVGLGSQDLAYDPHSTTLSATDRWNIALVAGQGFSRTTTSSISGTFDIEGGGDILWIASSTPTSATNTSALVSAVGHDNAPGALATATTALFGSGSVLLANIGAQKVVYNTGSDLVTLDQSTTGTLGIANSTANATWLDTMQQNSLVPEPSRAGLLLLAMLRLALVRRR